MKQSFKTVINSQINNSKTKESHRFAQQSRFPKTKEPYCQTLYDLGRSTDLASSLSLRKSNLGRSKRFHEMEVELKQRSLSRQSNSYDSPSFATLNLIAKKGNKFGNNQRFKGKDSGTPGPTKYNPKYNPEAELSYTMRAKAKGTQKHWNNSGPGSYNIAKPLAQTSAKMGHSPRFKAHETRVPAPGTYDIQSQMNKNSESKFNNTANYTFTKSARTNRLNMTTPGPGYYQEFSEFANTPTEELLLKTLRYF